MDTYRIGIQDILRVLGVGRQYMGYAVTVKAIGMVMQDESCLNCVKQGIYLPLSEAQSCDWRTIERNIRTVIHRAWRVNGPVLTEMAGYRLQQEPTVTEFLDILSGYLMREALSPARPLRRKKTLLENSLSL